MKKLKPKAVIFDAFGVLISDGILGMAEKLALEMGLAGWSGFFQRLPFWQENWRKLWLGEMNEEEMEKGIASQLGEKRAKRFFTGWEELTKADKKMVSLVGRLKGKKEFKLGLLVNTPPRLLTYLRQEISLDLFDEAVFSCETDLMKPDPRIFKTIVKKLKVRTKDCLFIDDGQKNIEAAKELGMRTVLFKDRHNLEKELETGGII